MPQISIFARDRDSAEKAIRKNLRNSRSPFDGFVLKEKTLRMVRGSKPKRFVAELRRNRR